MTDGLQESDGFNAKTLRLFLLVTFGLTWGLAALLKLYPSQLEAIFGPVNYTNPLFILAVYAPAIAAFVVVVRTHGARGIVALLRRLTLWRMPGKWWALLVFGIPACFYAGAAMRGNLGQPFPFTSVQALFTAHAAALLIGPIEEFGWRGVVQPLLQRRIAPFWAGMTVGVVWGLWHFPAFLLSGTPQESWSFPAFFVGVVAIAIILTPMFNAARGSLLIAALFHFQTNGPAWPDAQPWDTVLFVCVAAVLTWLNADTMFRRDAGATEVLAGKRHAIAP